MLINTGIFFVDERSKIDIDGKQIFDQFIGKLHTIISSHFLTNQDVQQLGKFFWRLLSDDFKSSARDEYGKNSFWSFSLYLKSRFISNQLEFVKNLWNHFDRNGRNLYVNLYSNTLENLVSAVF